MVGNRRAFIWAMVLVGIASSLMFVTSLSLPVKAAGESISDPTIDWNRQADSFIYYRYLYSCYDQHDVGKTSQSDTEAGKWFQLSLAGDFNSNLGYLAPNDKTTSCGDAATVTAANSALKFAGNMDAFCSIQSSAKSNGGSDKAGCMDGSADFDMENGTGGQTRDFENAAQAVNSANKNIYSNSDVPGYILYIVMKKSLENMCGGGTLLTATNTASSDGGNAAKVTYVNPMTGKISTNVLYKYDGNKEDGSNIPDLYAKYDGKRDGGECNDFSTGNKNSLNQYADSFASAVVKNWNDQVAAYFKANFKTNDALNEAVCGKAPAPGADPRATAGYGQCVAGITVKFNSQVDTCVAKLGEMSADDRVQKTRQCIKEALPAYMAALSQIPDPSVDKNVDEGDVVNEPTTCAIDGLGWFICPAMTFLASLNDAAFGILNNFLEVRPALISDDATFSAWERFRDFANIAFVIAFMIIVYSQITSVGVSNYGIKKLLPKLFLAAVLVNISYWICAIAVDLSNIVGASIYDLFKTIGDSVKGGGGTGLDDQIGGLWSTVMAYVLGGAAIVLLLVVVITAPMTLLALGVVVLILIARQALVILLLIAAPLAFVAYILPNTESWFTKWRKAFIATLMVYPVIGIIFGASTLAAKILMNVSGDNGNLAANGDDENMLKIIALGVLAVPLFTVPAVLKGSLAAMGSVSGKISGLQDRANGISKNSAARRAKSLEAKMATNNLAGQSGMKGKFGNALGAAGNFRARRKFNNSSIDAESSRLQEEALAHHVLDNDNYTDRQQAIAAAQIDKHYEEEVKSAGSRLQSSLSHDQIVKASASGTYTDGNGVLQTLNEHERDYAVRYTMERGHFLERQATLEGAGSMSRSQRKSAVAGARSKGDADVYTNAALAKIERTDVAGETGISASDVQDTLKAGVTDKVNTGTMSAQNVTKDHRTATYIASTLTGPGATVNATARTDLHNAINDYKTSNPQAWSSMDAETQTQASSI